MASITQTGTRSWPSASCDESARRSGAVPAADRRGLGTRLDELAIDECPFHSAPADSVVHGTAVVQSTGRLVAAVGDPGQPLRLDTTRGLDAATRFPELIDLPKALAPHRLILDGEVVAFGDHGRPSFGQLQHRMHLTRPAEIAQVAARIPARYVIFDLLWLDDRDLTRLPYLQRRELLVDVVAPGDGWLVPGHHVGGAADLLEAAKAQHLEGIVTKRVDSPYLPGKRSPLWRKVKVRPRQEFVIGGWHPGERGLAGKIGSLLVGVYEGDTRRSRRACTQRRLRGLPAADLRQA